MKAYMVFFKISFKVRNLGDMPNLNITSFKRKQGICK